MSERSERPGSPTGGWIIDTVPSEKYPSYSRANAGEVYPDPVSPLCGSLCMLQGMEPGWRDAYARPGTLTRDEYEPDRPQTLAIFGGYFFINISLPRVYGVRFPGLTPQLVDFQYFGDMPGIPAYEDEARPTDEDPSATARLQSWLETYVFARDDLPELRTDVASIDRMIAERPPFAEVTDQELVDRARSFAPLYRRLFCRHILVTAASGIGIGTVGGVCEAIGDPGMTMTLVAGLGDVDSAAPSMAMWDLGRTVRASPSLTGAFEGGVSGLAERVGALPGGEAAAFVTGLDAFLDRFEARGPNEWELRSATWGTNPELALAAIDRMRLAGDEAAPGGHLSSRTEDAEEAAAKVRAMLSGDPAAEGQFEAGLRAARLFTAGRERTKTSNIRVVHEMRLSLREVGRRLVERGALDAVEQVFMFTDDELDEVLEAPERWTAVAREREARYLELFELEPPFILKGAPPPLSAWSRRDAHASTAAVAGASLRGIPGCPGTATGRARIITDPSDPTALEPGDVLVAPITDPAWTPLFVTAAAVVVDVGAQVSHAVIVSRELGIPCVVSVTDATRTIPDGATVTVDGTAGTVTIDSLT